jgi:hypothetical protein
MSEESERRAEEEARRAAERVIEEMARVLERERNARDLAKTFGNGSGE